jgi:hypothetical protein
MTNTAGTLRAAARVRPSWNAPVLVAPSPTQVMATRASCRDWNASANPVMMVAEVPM